MSHFVLQTSKELDLESYFLEEQLKQNKYVHTYVKIDEPYLVNDTDYPVGEIPFVEKCLGIHENPVEVPKYLRTPMFLKRDYKICTWQDIPRSGVYFLKDISQLKKFSSVMNATYTDIDDLFNYVKTSEFDATLVLDKEHLYQVSSLIDIKAEYRVYVFGGDIEQISYYNGDCTKLPDISLIKKAVNLINYNEKYLKSYTIDVAVTNNGTCILEVHNFTSCGLYSTIWGSSLIYAYKDGIDYLRNDNHKLEV